MGYYRVRDGEARSALDAALSQLRELVALHPERAEDDESLDTCPNHADEETRRTTDGRERARSDPDV